MEFTGERFVPGTPGPIKLEHLQRYWLCREVVRGKRVLDLACGEGYGSAMLAATAGRVIGVDIDPATVDHARATYGHLGNVAFYVGACDGVPLEDGAVDVVVSFETIEHHVKHSEMLSEVKRVLAPEGLFILSSPNQPVYSAVSAQANPFHMRELTREQLEALLTAEFAHVRFWGQRLAVGCFTYALGRALAHSPPYLQSLTIMDDCVAGAVGVLEKPVYLLAACSESPVDVNLLPLDSVIVEPADDLHEQREAAIRHYVELCQRQCDVAGAIEEQLAEQIGRAEALQAEVMRLRDGRAEDAAVLHAQQAELEEHSARLERMKNALEQLRHERAQTEQTLTVALTRVQEEARSAAAHVSRLERQLAILQGSRSWRWTAPLRAVGATLDRGRPAGRSRAGNVVRAAYRRLMAIGRGKKRLTGAGASWASYPVAGRFHVLQALLTAAGWRPSPVPPRLPQLPIRLHARSHTSPAAEPPAVASPPFELAVPPLTAPEGVSIVIPVFNHADLTLQCLRAIVDRTPPGMYEIIVVDDASTDATAELLMRIAGIQVVRNECNRGFGEACNQGARRARGDALLFLNNDTVVLDGWLPAMVTTLAQDPAVGAVGAQLIALDGRLQEAGSIVWTDGTGWNYGRGEDRDRPEYAYLREVDYCSAACLLVRRRLFEEVGGFDPRYAPAYYEDTDLCFVLRARGFRIVYQPRARVVHIEGATAGTDIDTGFKRYQDINRAKFVSKHARALTGQCPPSAANVWRARDRRPGARILLVDHMVPHYDCDSGSVRMFELLRLLGELGHAVTFLPDNLTPLQPYTETLQQMGVEVIYGSMSLSTYLTYHLPRFEVAILCRAPVASRHLEIALGVPGRPPLIFDTVDLHYLREERRAALSDDPRLAHGAGEIKSAELAVARVCDMVWVVSPYEAEVLRKEDPGLRVGVIPNIHRIRESVPPFATRQDLLFVGGFRHPPNVDAVHHFVADVFPLIKRELPDLRLIVVGPDAPSSITALAAPDVIIAGHVRDLDALLGACRISVAPLRYGAGLKGKIGQSLAHGLPTVTTSVGAEGLQVEDGRHLLIGDDAPSFAAKTVQLYRDPVLWQRLSDGGRRHIEAHLSSAAVKPVLAKLLEELLPLRGRSLPS